MYQSEADKKGQKASVLRDGDKHLWIPTETLAKCCVLVDGIIYGGSLYPMVPSTAASVVFLLQHVAGKSRG